MKRYTLFGILILSIVFLVVFSFIIGGRTGYFLLFNPAVAGYQARSLEFKSHTDVVSDIPYGSDSRQLLDIYTPEDGEKPYPVLVFFHGGKWVSNSKDTFSVIGKSYIENGIMFVSVNYRLAPQHPYPTPVSDCELAVKWIYENISRYNGDPERIILSGHSAGAHLCSLITIKDGWIKEEGLPPDIIKGCVVISGPTDLNQIRYREIKSFIPKRSLLSEASPINHIKEDLPPFVVIYGTGDYMVPRNIPEAFVAQLRDHNIDVIDIALPMRTHLQVLDDFYDEKGFVMPYVLELLGEGKVSHRERLIEEEYSDIENERIQKMDTFQNFLLWMLVKSGG